VRVAIAGRADGIVLVEAPLAPGERVVLEGVQRLRDGAPVEIAGDAPEMRPGAVGERS